VPNLLKFQGKWLLFAFLVLIAFPALARPQASSTKPITTIVTVLGPNYTAPPPIQKEDVNVYSGKTRLDVLSWTPAQGPQAELQLAILIDDEVSPMLGNQIKDLGDFIRSQAPDTQVGLFYAEHGSAVPAAKFTTDHDAVAKKLRLPAGRIAGESPSIYLSVSDLVKRWPAGSPRREALVIASGTDILDPHTQDPYFDASVEDTQKAGVLIHSIYAGSNRLGRTFRGLISQGNLGELTSQSGGDAFFEGTGTPVAFSPFLRQLDAILQNQYLLTFTPPAGAHSGQLRPIQIRTEQHNVKVLYPRQVRIPAGS
jgi:hypothetical protein